MNYIVIGASGYIGQCLFQRASQLHPTIGTASRATQDLIRFDLAEPQNFDITQINQDSVVFLTAAISSPDLCAKEPERVRQVNLHGTAAFITQALARGARVIFFSSDTVYGETAQTVFEDTPCNPVGLYGQMKYELEQTFIGQPGFKSIRLSYVFSRQDKFTEYLINCAQHGRCAEVFDNLRRSVVHRDDVVQGALNLAARWDEFPEPIINFGGPECLTRAAIAQALQQSVLPTLQISIVAPPAGFFQNRPQTIDMQSNILPRLLGTPQHSVRQAAIAEFS